MSTAFGWAHANRDNGDNANGGALSVRLGPGETTTVQPTA
jgi:hypothetical protein